jgi:hypothetical protein
MGTPCGTTYVSKTFEYVTFESTIGFAIKSRRAGDTGRLRKGRFDGVFPGFGTS